MTIGNLAFRYEEVYILMLETQPPNLVLIMEKKLNLFSLYLPANVLEILNQL